MSFPESLITELDTYVAEELLAHIHDVPASLALQAWCDDLRIDVGRALAQRVSVLFPGVGR